MAIYQCVVPQGAIAVELRPRIAAELTRIHCEATSAAPEFVQVVFVDVPPGAAFAAGRPSTMSNIAGYIRAGRSPEVRTQLFHRIHAAWTELTRLPAETVKITLFDVPSGWIMQDGRPMPEPGRDAEWLAAGTAGRGP
jgi:phenylpyruvate tautomerase PptA (4-oxalocrotonate tautomerase family)